jgi:hypothetical protein
MTGQGTAAHRPSWEALIRTSSLAVTTSTLVVAAVWNGLWNEFQENCVRLVLSVHDCAGVCAGSAFRAPQRSSLNPRVRGSSPWRRTRVMSQDIE